MVRRRLASASGRGVAVSVTRASGASGTSRGSPSRVQGVASLYVITQGGALAISDRYDGVVAYAPGNRNAPRRQLADARKRIVTSKRCAREPSRERE